MSRSSLRALALALATIMCCALVAGSAQAASKAEKKQNSSIKKNRSTASKAASNARKARADAKKVDVKAFKALLVAVKATFDAAKANGDVATINGVVVPAAIKGLTDLQTGLLALKAGLEQAGAGLTKLAAFTAADEYGVVEIAVAGTPVGGCFYETGNIPDNVQDAMVSGTCNVTGGTAVAGGAISVNAAIRSNESDGVSGGAAAGVAGIVAFTTTNAALGGSPVVVGFGATGPNAGLGGAPAASIPLKSAPTSTTETSFPFSRISTDTFVDLATGANGFAGSGAPTLPASGGAASLRAIEFTVRFNDLTADANDPTA